MENVMAFVDFMKIVVAVLAVIISTLTSMYGVKNKKLKKIAEHVNFFRNYVEKFVVLAEDFQDFSGHSKKEWVLTKVHQMALDHGIPFDYNKVDKLIESAVELTKQVNARPQDQQARNVNRTL